MRSSHWKRSCIIMLAILLACPLFLGFSTNELATEADEAVDMNSDGLAIGESYVFNFEDATAQGWYGRLGYEVVAATNENAYGGEYSLKVTNRLRTHSGPTVDVSEYVKPNRTYRFSAWVYSLEEQEPENIQMLLQYNPGEGDVYQIVTGRTVNAGQWVLLSGEYTLKDFSGPIQIYFENGWNGDVPGEYSNFYVDDVTILRIEDPKPLQIQEDIPSLKDVFTEIYGDNFKFGSSLLYNEIEGAHGELLKKHFNSLTLGNELKWDATEPQEGVFDFTRPDLVMEFAENNGIAMRGHTLIWHSQTPNWVFYDENGNLASKELLYERMKNHIQTVMKRYEGKIYAWDVVNEVVEPWDTYRGYTEHGLRNSLWYQIAGEEYIKKAFEFAYEADPTAKLFINDYNTNIPDKRDAIYELIKRLNDEWEQEGSPVRIHGVGHQTHIGLYGPSLDELDAMIEKFTDLGIEQQITELDMSIYQNDDEAFDEFPEELAIKQAHRYRKLFDIFEKYKEHLTAIIFWGKDDLNTWLRTFPTTRNNWPLLFDERLQAKYAYWALVDYDQVPLEPINLTREAGAKRGTPIVDGEIDPIWIGANEIVTDRWVSGNEGATAKAKLLWDDEYLYVLIEITDSYLSDASANPWEQDSVEIYVDQNNGKTASYESDDGQYRINFNNHQTVNPELHSDKLLSATQVTEQGYRVEAAIKWHGNPLTSGDIIGFDVQVNDDSDGDGIRDSVAIWNDLSGLSYQNTSGFGIVRLLAQESVVPLASEAKYGTPTIDAEVDPIWTNANEIVTERWIQGSEGAIAKAKTLWDEGHLYVLIEVTDPYLTDTSANVWEQDSVEIFIDQNHAKTESYDNDDGQYRINYKNLQSATSESHLQRLQSSAKVIEGGYIVEAAIQWVDEPPQANSTIGFDVQVNDDHDGDGIRDSIAIWNDNSGESWQNISGIGSLKLLKQEEEEEQPTPTPTPTPTATSTPTPTATPKPSPTPKNQDSSDQPNEIPVQQSNAKKLLKISYSEAQFNYAIKHVAGGKLVLKAEDNETYNDGVQIELTAVQLERLKNLNVDRVALETGSWTMELSKTLLLSLTEPNESLYLTIEEINEQGTESKADSNHIFDFSISAGNKRVTEFPVNETLKIRYVFQLSDNEKSSQIVAREIHSDELAQVIKRAWYNEEEKLFSLEVSRPGKFIITSVPKKFKDLNQIFWAEEAIEALAARQIIQGISEHSFSPQSSITREQFIHLIVQALDLNLTDNPIEHRFTDVNDEAYYEVSINTAFQLGIVSGITPTTFGTGYPITRQEMFVILHRAVQAATIKLAQKGEAIVFTDESEIASYAKAAVTELSQAGIVEGKSNYRLDPNGTATRAEAALLLYRILKQQ